MDKFKILLVGLSVLAWSCTDLEVEELDSVVVDDVSGEFSGVNPGENLTSAYVSTANSVGSQDNTYALMEVSSDAQLVPTRGTDWGDNGVWRTLHQHTWDATHQFNLNAWNNQNSNVFALNQIIAPESEADPQQLAEAKFLRALNVFIIMDLWGQVPFRDPNDGVDTDPRVLSRQEAVTLIEEDLSNTTIENLPNIGPGDDSEILRASQASAHFLRAKFYLNKHILLGNPSGSAPDNADMDRVIEAVDAVTAAGFSLEEDYFEIFDPAPDNESIFTLERDAGGRIWNTLHYNHNEIDGNAGGGWNGFCTTAEFYSIFEGDANSNTPGSNQETRRGFVPEEGYGYGFLVGQQYGYDGQELSTRNGEPLAFKSELPGLAGNSEATGIRVLKYHPDNGGAFPGRQILFRYADAVLMKAEANLWKGNTGEALQLVNDLRDIRGASPLASLDAQEMLDERGREMYIEFWRRQDQIRFGTFTQPWSYKDNTEEFRVLFPIPSLAISTNPNLEQNPGY
ncbi:RagB/SusD family nutrient uptake outer membrane protein [Marivirga harenae]|uniref:RagB/SusD family nutrient uptake outer membrane protein n=1 Tax=Marivirga harenae TaxID=2010992 RepID=UPI0026DEAC05|nr:RagB/SusD family nutrient uptake outer membrane protein [Marivirga harenae]WKV11173.1 RagB/SusD family nutrient uptake outer membrane protein [Marivirga harenae]|tara:strand:+ start:35971 stop:37503 length:1533 start_codon:yes stop_codon:yes gene_type:complete